MEDEQVMWEVREGAVGKLELLFDRHHTGILRYFQYLTSNRTLSEDLAQEVFFRVLKYRQSYQPDGNFRAWLYQIARNVYADQLGRQKPEVAMPEEAREIRGAETPPDREFQKKQEALMLRRALAAMPGDKARSVDHEPLPGFEARRDRRGLEVRSGNGQGAGIPGDAGFERPVFRAEWRTSVMNCERIREQIPEALAGRLDKTAREALVEHLEGWRRMPH